LARGQGLQKFFPEEDITGRHWLSPADGKDRIRTQNMETPDHSLATKGCQPAARAETGAVELTAKRIDGSGCRLMECIRLRVRGVDSIRG
jgi:hypothetical protein